MLNFKDEETFEQAYMGHNRLSTPKAGLPRMISPLSWVVYQRIKESESSEGTRESSAHPTCLTEGETETQRREGTQSPGPQWGAVGWACHLLLPWASARCSPGLHCGFCSDACPTGIKISASGKWEGPWSKFQAVCWARGENRPRMFLHREVKGWKSISEGPPSFCVYDIIQETFKQHTWNEMSCQVVACDIYRQPLTHKERLQRSHTYKQLLPSARPPPPCSCHWLCKKIKKERKGLEKKLGPLADLSHSEAEDGKKLWKQEPCNGMDSQDTFSAMDDLTAAPLPLPWKISSREGLLPSMLPEMLSM